MRKSRIAFACAIVCAAAVLGAQAQPGSRYIQFVFTSDLHYGITRAAFRGAKDVNARVVNQALVASLNALSAASFARDGGNRSGELVGPVEFVSVGGDIANRAEQTAAGAIQPAAASWAQFTADYLDGLTLRDRSRSRSAVYMVPGNHEASNVLGYYKPMQPPFDASAFIGIYNHMMAPAPPRTAATFDYARDKVLTTRDVGGVHFMFLTIWPDSKTRAWIDDDLMHQPAALPAVIFTHDQPDVESKHFTNPNGRHDINDHDQFENLLADQFADGPSAAAASLAEQRDFEAFLVAHPTITAYFHGNSNFNQFYDWPGPGHHASLHVFRVDSPMKGQISAKDETKLSFQVATIDTMTSTMTVRECLWNADVASRAPSIRWGASATVRLAPPSTRAGT